MDLESNPVGTKSKSWLQFGLVGFLFLILAVLLVWLLFFNSGLTLRIVDLKNQIGRQNQAISDLLVLKQESLKARALQEKINFILPDTERLLAISAELEEIGRRHSVNQSFSFGGEAPATAAEPKAVGFGLALTSDLDKLLQYLKNLESFPYVLNFSQIDISLSGGTYQINSSGKIYSQ